MEKKYKYKNRMATMAWLETTWSLNCAEWRKAILRFIELGYNLYDAIPIDSLVAVAKHLGRIDWLIEEGVIEEVEEFKPILLEIHTEEQFVALWHALNVPDHVSLKQYRRTYCLEMIDIKYMNKPLHKVLNDIKEEEHINPWQKK